MILERIYIQHEEIVKSMNIKYHTTQTVIPEYLDVLSCWLLKVEMNPEDQEDWKVIYSMNDSGHSWQQFSKSVVQKGPTLLIVKDTFGNIFGAYARESWSPSPNFYGNAFIFQIAPKLKIYLPTNFNQNFQYFNQGCKMLPNGLGIGGQLGFFALWIDSNFKNGESRPTATFENQSLSSHPEFVIKDLIVVQLTNFESTTSNPDSSKRNEALHFLDLAGARPSTKHQN